MQLVYPNGSMRENFCNNIGKLWGTMKKKNTIFRFYTVTVGKKQILFNFFRD